MVAAQRDTGLAVGDQAKVMLGKNPGNIDVKERLMLSLFLAVVMTLGRLYRESEMTIWFASGIGLSRFVKPVLRFAWPVLAVEVLRGPVRERPAQPWVLARAQEWMRSRPSRVQRRRRILPTCSIFSW